MREENIFYKLAKNGENATTELLCNLCKFAHYKELIFNELQINNDLFTYQNIDTQYNIPGKRKIPDIKIENEKNIIFVENKISKYRELEPSQLTVYPEHLKKISDKSVKLLFLIPKGYKNIKKINKARKKYKFISIIFWDELLQNIKTKNKIIKSEILYESITFFEKILNTIPEINFNQEEIHFMSDMENLIKESMVIGKQLELFGNIIEQLKEKLNLQFKKTDDPWIEGSENCIGVWFYRENCFIGYSFGIIAEPQLKDYVLSFAINKDIVNKEKLKRIPKNTFGFDGECYYFKIDMKLIESEGNGEKIYQYCEKIMKDIVKNIK